jgi:hypothetical protein
MTTKAAKMWTIFAAFRVCDDVVAKAIYFPDASFSAAREMLRMLRIA